MTCAQLMALVHTTVYEEGPIGFTDLVHRVYERFGYKMNADDQITLQAIVLETVLFEIRTLEDGEYYATKGDLRGLTDAQLLEREGS